jgi:large subunit ribosomal protein L18
MKGVTSVITKLDKNASRKKRHARVRSKISGTALRPRLNVFRSNKYIYAQLIDDTNGVTLVSASSMEKDFEGNSTGNLEAAAKIGETIAKRAVEQGLTSIVFDRGGYLYHGRVKALAEAARENGLEF